MIKCLRQYPKLGYILLLGVIFFGSCTGTRKIPEGEFLYGGAEIKLRSDISRKKRKELNRDLENTLTPKPNGKLLWMRPGVSIHNTVKKPGKDKGIKHWWKYKIGKEPVLYDLENSEKVSAKLANTLFHKGFFQAKSEFEEYENGRVKYVNFIVETGVPHIVDTVVFPNDTTKLNALILKNKAGTLIEEGENYDLEKLKNERVRIAEDLKTNGYYFFEANDLYFRADSASTKNKVKLDLHLKPDIPKSALDPYRIDKIYVFDDYNIETKKNRDTTSIDDYYYLSTGHFIRPEIVLDEVFLEKGKYYNSEIHERTIRYLSALGNFRYVNIQYVNENDSAQTLDANIYLSPYKKYSISAELNAVTKTNNYAGPGIRLSFLNRNIFRGSEILSTNLNGRYDWQITNFDEGNTSLETSLETSLIIPRIVPFHQNKENKRYLGSSRATLGVGFYNRVKLYKFVTYSTSFKYSWAKQPRILHDLIPIDISLTNLLETSEEFEDYLDTNPSVRRSLEEQFIFGLSYNFTYNAMKDKNFLYTGGIELAGNTLSMIDRIGGDKPNSDDPSLILGVPYSQFVRLKNEVRKTFNVGKNTSIATRLIASAGFPYGNSSVLPYVRQFFAGGTNSIRAFRARSVGPGSYFPTDTASFFQVDQSGDIQLEANIEFRFPIVNYLKGALFLDAGNIWLINEDPFRPGGKFEWDSFYKQLAIGFGYGLRIDLDILVIRFDWAFPLYTPYIQEGSRWNDIDFLSKQWRKDNIILNISIGYPF